MTKKIWLTIESSNMRLVRNTLGEGSYRFARNLVTIELKRLTLSRKVLEKYLKEVRAFTFLEIIKLKKRVYLDKKGQKYSHLMDVVLVTVRIIL